MNPRAIDWTSPFIWGFSTSLFAVAVLGKLLGAVLLRDSWKERLAIGIAMIPRGEVGLIFAEFGRTSGMLNNEIYAALIIAIAVTTQLAPILMKGYCRYLHPST